MVIRAYPGRRSYRPKPGWWNMIGCPSKVAPAGRAQDASVLSAMQVAPLPLNGPAHIPQDAAERLDAAGRCGRPLPPRSTTPTYSDFPSGQQSVETETLERKRSQMFAD